MARFLTKPDLIRRFNLTDVDTKDHSRIVSSRVCQSIIYQETYSRENEAEANR